MEELRAKRGFICDMDGVIYHGDRLLPGVREFLCSYDPILEGKPAGGICVPWLPEKWENLLWFSSDSRGDVGCHSVGVSYGSPGQVCQRAGASCKATKNVGVEETSPRHPHFSVTGESPGVRAGNRPNHNGTNQNWKTW